MSKRDEKFGLKNPTQIQKSMSSTIGPVKDNMATKNMSFTGYLF